MEKTVSYKSYFENELVLIKLIGSLWYGNGYGIKRKVTFILIQLMFSIFCVASAWLGAFNENNSLITICTMSVPPIIGNAALLKGYYLLKYNWRFQELYHNMIDDYEEIRTTEEEKMIEDSLKFYTIVKKLLLAGCVFSIMATVIIPIEQNQYLPFAYPVDVSTSPFFELAFIQEVIAFLILVTVYIFPEILLLGSTIFVGLQYDLICHNLIQLQDILSLKMIIVRHGKILSLVKTVEEIFSRLYLVHFVTSTMILAVGLFIITQSTSYTPQYFASMSYVVIIFGMLLFPSWCSSEMSRKIEQLPYAAFACSWIEGPTSAKRDLVYFTQMSQIPVNLKAVGLFPISLETFVTILRTSFSYYTLLKTIYSKDNGQFNL